jgi:predicted transposase YdaD
MLMTEWKPEDAPAVEREEGREGAVRNLLKKGWSIEKTAEIVKLGIERLRALSVLPKE